MLKHRRRWLAPATAFVALLVALGFGVRWFLLTMNDPLANLRDPAATPYEPDAAPVASVRRPVLEVNSDVPSSGNPTMQTPRNSPSVEPRFLVQLGAFRSETRAGRLAQAATQAGFPSSVVRGSSSSGETLFRVQVIQALNKMHAEQLAGEARGTVPGVDPIVVERGR
jgi:cell division septation protein DedD